jgi:general secretion pathway protein I
VRKAGFTLLEILVALALLGVAIVMVLELFSADIKAIMASEDYVSAVMKAEAKMREVLDDDKLEEGTTSEAMENGCVADVTVSEVMKERTESLPVRLLEITLMFHWTKGTTTRALTLKTMKVVTKKV